MCKRLCTLLVVGLVLGISGQAMAGIIAAEELLVDLRAEDLAYGAGATTWVNHGTLDDFTAMGNPVVEDVDGRKAVTFDGSSYFQGPLSPAGIHGSGTRSIEVWAYNGSNLVGEETMVSWSHRGGPDGTNIAFNYGNHGTWGAVGHWGAPDMPWSAPHAPAPAPENWVYLVYTYDGATVRLYVNGEANTSEDASLNTHGPNIIRVAAQANDSGAGVNAALSFTGSIAEVRIHDGVLSPADIANNFVSKPGEPIAKDPDPEDGQTDVPRDVILSWGAGEFAATHDVYLGESFDDVNAAGRANPMGVLISQGQAGTTCDPAGDLDFSTTYYWRVDEVNAAPDNTVFRGDVWSFTTEPFAYAIAGVTATTNGVSDAGSEPEKAVDGSGLNANGQHTTEPTHMWLATAPAGESLNLECTFDKAYKLHEMQVWNHNTMFEFFIGFGIKNVTVEYSADGAEWTVLGDYDLGRGTGTGSYTANTTIACGDVVAQAVRLTVNSAYGTSGKCGLSEVRFLYIPAQARGPEPADGAVGVDVDADLTWRPGREATQHQVYLDTTDATTLAATTQVASYEPGTLDLGTTYRWKVDEIEASGTWAGPVWSFSTQEYFVVDDFEGYSDDWEAGEAIWQTWIDGWEDNSNGSQVGYTTSPFAEQDIVYSGRQSMPLFYNNAGPKNSYAERTWSTPQNWAKAGAERLVINFRGDFANAADSIYAMINGTRVDYPGDGSIITRPLWKQWSIDLSVVPNLQSVQTLRVGVSGNGDGVLYVDAIRLYRSTPDVAMPVNPGTDGLALHYAFEGNVLDGSGNGYDGTVADSEIYENSAYGDGQAMTFDGINDHVEVPIGSLIASTRSMTVSTRFNMLPNANNWQRIFDFGTSNTQGYMFLCPQMGTGGSQMRFAITKTAGGAAESIVDVPGSVAEGWHHVAVVIDSAAMTATIYLDGDVVASGPIATVPSDLGQTTQNWLGRSQYPADGYYMGQLDEFRIYTRPLSAGEVRYLAGDR